MIILIDIIYLLFLAIIIFWLGSLFVVQVIGAPSVFANKNAIRKAFNLAGLKKGQLVLDLGCGDARSLIIAVKEFGAKGIGIERSPYCFIKAKLNVWKLKEKNIRIYFGNFQKYANLLKESDVVYMYLLNQVLAEKETWFFQNIGFKTRIVSLAFKFRKHKPVGETKVINLGKKTKVRLYIKK